MFFPMKLRRPLRPLAQKSLERPFRARHIAARPPLGRLVSGRESSHVLQWCWLLTADLPEGCADRPRFGVSGSVTQAFAGKNTRLYCALQGTCAGL